MIFEETVSTLENAKRILGKMEADHLVPEISEEGLGSELFKSFKAGESVTLEELVRWAFTEMKGGAVMEEFEKKF